MPSVRSGAGSNYSLPLYLCHTDTDVVLTQAEGDKQRLAGSEDVLYRALDHRLFWFEGQPSGNMLLFCEPEAMREHPVSLMNLLSHNQRRYFS